MLEAVPGVTFCDRTEGPVLGDSLKDRGTHGYLPTRSGLEATFIAVGREITAGKNLGHISLRQIAPTLASLMGLPVDISAPEQKPIELRES